MMIIVMKGRSYDRWQIHMYVHVTYSYMNKHPTSVPVVIQSLTKYEYSNGQAASTQ